MENSAKIAIMGGIEKFPIGGSFSEYNLEKMDYLTAKAAVIAYLAGFEQGLTEDSVRSVFTDALGSSLPNVPLAENKLRLSTGFVEDYGKVELIREGNKTFDEMINLIRSVAETYGYTNGMSR